jgi:peptidoglycan/LPS O-acetylase OafA/YrhL
MPVAFRLMSSPVSSGYAIASVNRQYRPDIDGLRAVAALYVIANHTAVMEGGFVGVDIFFAISGYLISGIIFRALREKRFSYLGFYARRVRRIFPALSAVLLTVSLLGWLLTLPDEYPLLGKDVATGATFVMNLTQWRDPEPPMNVPRALAHLWSLGVEEQFYIFWPVFLLAIWKTAKARILAITLAVTALSFALDVAFAMWKPWETFALPWNRLWELSLGGLLAYMEMERGNCRPPAYTTCESHKLLLRRITGDNARGVLGSALLIVSGLVITPDDVTRFPGIWALPPSIGSFLLLSAGQGSWVNRRVLSAAPMVFLGLISYPLYLWQWPLLLVPEMAKERVTPMTRAVAVIIAVIVSFCTYKCIELQVRSTSRPKLVTSLSVIIIIVCTGIGFMIFMRALPPHRA